MRQREEHELSAEARRELEALDRALAGESVDRELEGLETLVRELPAARPEPPAAFAAELDELAASGFKRAESRSTGDRLRAWLAGVRPAQVLAPAGALATVAIVISVAVIRSDGGEPAAPEIQTEPGAANLARPDGGGTPEVPSGEAVGSGRGETALEGDGGPASTAPPATDIPMELPRAPAAPGAPVQDRLAPGQPNRAVESSASIGLSTEADEFDEVADGVVATTDRYRGLVVSSDETTADGVSRATFELAIPSDRLQEALADLSELAHVESRSEATRDITAPTVGARADLTDAQAEVDSLLRQLAEADTPAETREIRARLDIARAQVAEARDDVRRLARRADLATVAATVTSDGSGDGDWGVEEALDDVADVLSTAAGVALVSLAVLVPLALALALIALAHRLYVRHGRERALDAEL